MPYDWIVRPEFAAGDWPAGELRGRLFPVPLALRLADGAEVEGSLTLVESGVLVMDDGDVLVPIGTVHAYAIRHELLDRSDELGRDPE